MTIGSDIAQELRVSDPQTVRLPDMGLSTAYRELYDSLEVCSDGAIVLRSWEEFSVTDWTSFSEVNQLSRHIVLLWNFPALRDVVHQMAAEEEGDCVAGEDELEMDPLDGLLPGASKLWRSFREFALSAEGRELVEAPARGDSRGFVGYTINAGGMSSSGGVRIADFNEHFVTVLSSHEGRGDYWHRVPVFLGFARKNNLHRSVGRVLTETIGRLFSRPSEVYGTGDLSDFEVAFIGGCVGKGDRDEPLGELLLAVDDASARAQFDVADSGSLALIEWAVYGCPTSDDEDEVLPTHPDPRGRRKQVGLYSWVWVPEDHERRSTDPPRSELEN